LVISEVNLPTLQVQLEGVDCQHCVGSHGCGVPSVPSKVVTHLSLLSQYLYERFMVMFCTQTFFYLNYFVFLPNFIISDCCFPVNL